MTGSCKGRVPGKGTVIILLNIKYFKYPMHTDKFIFHFFFVSSNYFQILGLWFQRLQLHVHVLHVHVQ